MYNITQKEFGKYFISYGGAEREIRFKFKEGRRKLN